MVAEWSSSHTYDATDIVTNYKKVYECKPHPFSGWCNDYEPGVESALPGSGGVMIPWRDAWTEKGDCREIEMDFTTSLLDSSESVYDSELCATPIYGKGDVFSAKDRVMNEDAIYECNVPSWCSSSIKEYEPGRGTYWKLAWTLVQESLGCPDVTDDPASDAAVATLAADYPAPTSYPTKLGRAVYYGDFRTTSCQNINDLMQSTPDWLQEEDMFKSKEECCNEMFSWLPLKTCLGPNFVESNYVIGSRSPTLTPTMSPTTVPSSRPSVSISSVPSSSPSSTTELDSDSIHQLSAATPTPPTNEDKLTVTSTSINQSEPDANFLVEMLGWANVDMLPGESFVDIFSSTSSPVEESSQISELTLPIVSDATLSRNRRSANFGSNTVLAVDGEADNRYDSLLKFDVGMIDTTRNIESAVLRVYSQSSCLETTFTTTVDSDWDHAEVTWDTAPSARRGGVLFGAIKDVELNEWYEIDITTAIEWHGNSTNFSLGDSNDSFLSIRLASTEKSRCLYSSMESGAHAPVVAIKYLMHDVVADPKPAAGQFILLQADADSTISASQPTTVLSKEPTLMVEFDPFTRNIHDALIRFDLSKTGGTYPRSAILSLFSEISCKSAGTIATTSGDTDWDESTITWSTAPGAGDGGQYQSNGVMIGTFGAVSKNRWHGFDVSEAIRIAILAKKKDATFRISSGNTESCLYSSIESGREPKLMISF